MKRGENILLISVVILFIGMISADFQVGNIPSSIESQYSQNDTIRGWINLSLNSEPSDAEFSDSLGNTISLLDLLKLNTNSSYDCLPTDCQSDYTASNPQSSKTFSLASGTEKILGFVFTGDNFQGVTDFSINVSSDAGESDYKQLYIDILSDDNFEWGSYKSSGNFYGENLGCYEEPAQDQIEFLNQYCEKISIPQTPNVEIGAYVINNTNPSQAVGFTMQLCDQNYNCNSCDTTASGTGRVSCIINQTINSEGDFFVCINAQSSADNSKYKINSETINTCGYAGDAGNPRDFEIFAKPGRYAPVGQIKLDNNELQNSGNFIDIADYIDTYIERYDSNCSQGCVVPISFLSSDVNQQVTVSGVNIRYQKGGVPSTLTQVYDVSETPSKISSNFQKIYFDKANFNVNGDFDKQIDYSLKLSGNEILSQLISIKNIPKILSINTKEAIAAYPTKFSVSTQASVVGANITKYDWDFGDGKKSTTNSNEAEHTYESIGNFTLKVTVTDSGNLNSSKNFAISVKTPKDAVNSVLGRKISDLDFIRLQIAKLPEFDKNSLSKILGITQREDDLSQLQQRNLTAGNDNDYVSIMNDLIQLKIPQSVFETKSINAVSLYPSSDKVNLDTLKEIGGGDYQASEASQYKDAVVLWNFENINNELNTKEYSATYGDSIEFVADVFDLTIKENRYDGDSFLIIPKLDNISFGDNYNEKEQGDFYYIGLRGEDNKQIEFSTTEDISFSDLPAFISPRISDLSVIGTNVTASKDKISQQTLIILVTLLVIFVGFIFYIVLQEWYKRRYENYLFKDKNGLYNIISYIQSAKKKGMKNDDIASKLRDSGWSSEQVRFVMRKYAGKRTGMFEIPVEKVVKIFKKGEDKNTQNRKFPPRRY